MSEIPPDDWLNWDEAARSGKWPDLFADAVRFRRTDHAALIDAAAFVETYALESQRPAMLLRLRQAESADWAGMIARAAAEHDLDGLRQVWAMIKAGAPADRRDGLLRRVQAAAVASQKTIDREAGKAAATAPAPRQRAEAPGPARRPSNPAADRPARRPSPSPDPVPAARAETEDGDGGDDRTARLARMQDAEAQRWAWELGRQTAKGNEKRAKVGGAEVVLTDRMVAESLDEWHEAVQVEGEPVLYVSSPMWTGKTLAALLCARRNLPTPVPVSDTSILWELPRRKGGRMLRVLGWADPSAEVLAGDVLAEFDVNAQHLAVAGTTQLGDGEPTHVLDAEGTTAWITAAWVRKAKISGRNVQLTAEGYRVGLVELVMRPGYVVLAAAPDLSGQPAHVRGAYARVTAGWVLPMPLAEYLVRDRGLVLDIAEAVFWDTRREYDQRKGQEVDVKAYGRRLEGWAQVVTRARKVLSERGAGNDEHPASLALSVLKPMYSEFTGAFLRSTTYNVDRKSGEPTPWLRPDWYDQIVSRASANMLRALDKAHAAGLVVVAGIKDAVWAVVPAASDGRPTAPAGLEISSQGGKWKLARWAVADDAILDAVAKRRPVPVREAVAAVHYAREQAAAKARNAAQAGAVTA
jgi:hypothetical protein